MHPSKAMLRPVVAVADARRVAGACQAGWLKSIGAELIRGHGRLDGHRRVAVATPDSGTMALTARHAVAICTSSRPALPELAGLAEARPWSPMREIVVIASSTRGFRVVSGITPPSDQTDYPI